MQTSAPPIPGAIEPPVKWRMRDIAKRVIDSGIDHALALFWIGAFAVMTSIAVAALLYIRGGRAAWLYPYLYFALGFITASLALIGISAILFYIRGRRRRTVEELKSARYISNEKGYLDYAVNFERALIECQNILREIGTELTKSGGTSGKIGARFVIAGTNVQRAKKVATNGAIALNKHAQKLERSHLKFEEIMNLMVESASGQMQWAPTASQGNKEPLANARLATIAYIDLMRNSIESSLAYRDSLKGVKGISQDVNSACNRLIHVTEEIASVMANAESNLKLLIGTIDNKLKS